MFFVVFCCVKTGFSYLKRRRIGYLLLMAENIMGNKWLFNKNALLAVLPFSALRDSFKAGYDRRALFKDLIAGLTVGIIAIPLSMALAIASGVAPQYGLYTAIVAGIVIALLGGSRFNISGPTAAFVVILYPVTQQFGFSGLLLATLLSGIILILMALFRLGRLIEYIPLPVTLGFTCGIGIVIAVLQIKDFLGLNIAEMPPHFLAKLNVIISALPSLSWADTAVGIITLLVLTHWHKLKLPISGHLPAVLLGTLFALLLQYFDYQVATIGSSFYYQLEDGSMGYGIPDKLPEFILPWQIPDEQGNIIPWDFDLLQALLPVAFSMAALGAIESLLCAVVLDNMTATKHHSNNELLAQGIGNLVAPFLGGITATAAIARSAANVKAGAVSPLASVFHALLVLLALLFFADYLSYLPLSSMSALLLVVAWNMANIGQIIQLLRRSGKSEFALLFTCVILTVIFDMVIAISAGVLLASLLFIKSIAEMTKSVELNLPEDLEETVAYRISGPLFFAAADNLFADLHEKTTNNVRTIKHIILQCEAVTVLDSGGIHALIRFVQNMQAGQQLYLCHLQFQPLKALVKANRLKEIQQIHFASELNEVFAQIRQL